MDIDCIITTVKKINALNIIENVGVRNLISFTSNISKNATIITAISFAVAISRKKANRIRSVSYTHLDVYKRQETQNEKIILTIETIYEITPTGESFDTNNKMHDKRNGIKTESTVDVQSSFFASLYNRCV